MLDNSLPRSVEVTQIDFETLSSTDAQKQSSILETLDKAYSDNGLGTLAVRGIPGFAEKRRKALL